MPQALQKDCLPYASRHADVTCMQWQWDIFFIGKISPKGEIQNSKFGKEVFCKSSVTKSEGKRSKNCQNCILRFQKYRKMIKYL